LRPVVEALPGGLGPDGSGNLAVLPQKVASGPQAPGTPVDSGASGPVTNSAPPDATSGALPADPNAPVTSSSPGTTAADTTNAPSAAPVASPPDKTPLPQ